MEPNIIEFEAFWKSTHSLRRLHNSFSYLERTNPTTYGAACQHVMGQDTCNVPVYFYKDRDRVISKTPMGRIIFPGQEMASRLELGCLYFLPLKIVDTGKSHYAVTQGIDCRTLLYWEQLDQGKKIGAIKEYYYAAKKELHVGLKEAKEFTEGDIDRVYGGVLPGGKPKAKPFNPPHRPVNDYEVQTPAKVSQLENEIAQLRDELVHYSARIHELTMENVEQKNELKEVYGKYFAMREQFDNSEPKKGELVLNVWDIIEGSPDMGRVFLEDQVKQALKLYHPDRVHSAGPLLQNYANAITIKLLEFRKQLGR